MAEMPPDPDYAAAALVALERLLEQARQGGYDAGYQDGLAAERESRAAAELAFRRAS